MVASRNIYGPRGAGCVRPDGYITLRNRLQHISIAEKVLGRSLPEGAQVHHADGNRANNVNSNLVICPDASYHQLLHNRMKALEASGNPNWKKCKVCLKWDSLENLRQYAKETVHLECNRLKAIAQRRKS